MAVQQRTPKWRAMPQPHAQGEPREHIHDDAVRRGRDLARVGQELEDLQRTAEQAGDTLEKQVRLEVRQRLDRALDERPDFDFDVALRRAIDSVVESAAMLVARKSKLRFDEERGLVVLSTSRPGLRRQLHDTAGEALARQVREPEMKAAILDTIERAIESLDGLQLDMDPHALAGLAQLTRGLRDTKQALRDIDPIEQKRTPLPPTPGPPTPALPEPEIPSRLPVHSGPTQPPEPPVPPGAPVPPLRAKGRRARSKD
jgi:hypothetical protein